MENLQSVDIKKLIREHGADLDIWVCNYHISEYGFQKNSDIPPIKLHFVDDGIYIPLKYYSTYYFLTEEEVIKCYNDLIWEQLQLYKNTISKIREIEKEVENKLINTDIVMETLIRE